MQLDHWYFVLENSEFFAEDEQFFAVLSETYLKFVQCDDSMKLMFALFFLLAVNFALENFCADYFKLKYKWHRPTTPLRRTNNAYAAGHPGHPQPLLVNQKCDLIS